VALSLLLCSCTRYPESYPPPEQRHPVTGGSPDPSAMMVTMTDADAPLHFVKDIDLEAPAGSLWRWAGPQPTLKILAQGTQNLKLSVDFTLWPTAFEQTGPVELTFFVNTRQLDKVRYTTPGDKHFQKPIPEDWLTTEIESTISIAIDKMFVGSDGKKFGFILSSAGFVQ
jgi:hypothetical protein